MCARSCQFRLPRSLFSIQYPEQQIRLASPDAIYAESRSELPVTGFRIEFS